MDCGVGVSVDLWIVGLVSLAHLFVPGWLQHVRLVSPGELCQRQGVVLWVERGRSVVGGRQGGVLGRDGLFVIRALEGVLILETATYKIKIIPLLLENRIY